MPPTAADGWSFLLWGYCLTVMVEIPVLLLGLSPRHGWRDRLIAGFWLTACTYPIVVIVLPTLVWAPLGRGWYLLVAETFAPLAECALFRVAYGPAADRSAQYRDYVAIVAANLLSFGVGELLTLIVRWQLA